MANLTLRMACGPYDRLRPLRDGTVRPDGIDLEYVPITSPAEVFARMYNLREFDVAEMSLAFYMILVAGGGSPVIALPVFPVRMFRHGFIYVHRDAGIRQPSDLAGKRIGVVEYWQTAAVWIRGMLQHDHAVDPATIRWIEGALNPNRDRHRPPPEHRRIDAGMHPYSGVELRAALRRDGISVDDVKGSLDERLATGELDALIGARAPACFGRSPDVTRLFPDHRTEERAYYARTRLFPIMHTLVIRDELYRAEPWIADSLCRAWRETTALAEPDPDLAGFGADLWADGIAANRHVLDTFAGYLVEQRLARRRVAVDELFAPGLIEPG